MSRMTRWGVLVAAGGLAVVLGGSLAVVAPAALADGHDCDEVLVDDAGVVDDPTALLAAADLLAAEGPLVRVRTFTTVPGGDLDATIEAVQDRCASWATPDGDWRNSLVVLAVSVDDRRSGVYYGGRWARVLDDRHDDVRTQTMNPWFRDGDYATGLAEGLGEIGFLLATADGPPRPMVPVAPGDGAGLPVADVPEPADGPQGSPLRGVLLLLGVGTVVAGGVGGTVLVRRGRRRGAARAAARRTHDAAAEHFLALEEATTVVRLGVAALQASVGDEDDAMLEGRLAEAVAHADAAIAAYLAARDAAPQERLATLTTREADVAWSTYTQVGDRLRAAHAGIEEFHARLDELDRAARELPDRLTALDTALADARARIESVAARGYATTAHLAAVQRCADGVRDARGAVQAERIFAAVALAEHAETGLAQAVAGAEGLPGRHAALLARVEGADTRLDEAHLAAETARSRLAQLQASYDASCWTSLTDGVAALAAQLDDARVQLEAARRDATIAVQQFDDADTALDACDAALAAAGQTCATVDDRVAELTRLAAGAAGRLSELGGERTDVARYVADHARDVDPAHEQTLAEVAQRCDALAREVSAPRPAWLAIDAELVALTDVVAQVRAAATAEHERMEQWRAEASRAVADAVAAIEEADRFLLLRFGVGFEARAHLRDAQAMLEFAEGIEDPRGRRDHARQAAGLAQQALDAARAELAARSAAQRHSGWGHGHGHGHGGGFGGFGGFGGGGSSSGSFGGSSGGGSGGFGGSSGGGGSGGFGGGGRGGGSGGF